MSESDEQQDRRKVIKLLGAGAVALPVVSLVGCGGGSEEGGSTIADVAADAADAAEEAVDTVAKKAEEAGGVVADAADTVADEAVSMIDKAEEAVGDAMDAAESRVESAMDTASDMVEGTKVDEDGAQAKSLGYKHDATTVDSGAQARYEAGQQCSNCQLYLGGGESWGACPIFAGNLVKSTGWCSAYVAAG